MSRAEQLTDEQWSLIEPLLTKPRRKDGRGRPRLEDRVVLNGVFWILRTGAPVADRHGLPVAVHVASASPHEITLAPDTVGGRFVASAPARLIGDRAYDSDKLDAELAAQGIELIAPHKSNRTRAPTQDGRALRR